MTHILIVEDDLAFGTMMQTWLKKKGFETSRATSVGAAARLLTDGTKPDLVLSDLRLPDHDGLFLLGRMRKRGHNAPFIVMTNYAEVQNAVLAMKLGAAELHCQARATRHSSSDNKGRIGAGCRHASNS